jgi:hypothetical protein
MLGACEEWKQGEGGKVVGSSVDAVRFEPGREQVDGPKDLPLVHILAVVHLVRDALGGLLARIDVGTAQRHAMV